MRSSTAATIAGAVLLASVTPVHAEEPRPLVRVGVFVVGADGPMAPSRQATMLLTLERALEDDDRLDVVDKDRALAERAGLVPAEVVSEARGLLESGEALLRKKRHKLALMRLQAAVRQLENALAWVKKRDLARAQFLLGAAHAILGEDDEAVAHFVGLLVWRPTFSVDTSIEPGAVLPLWETARKKATALPGGSLEIRSTPDRALAYVDGRFVGFTPTVAEGLTQGAHYVTFLKLGYSRAIVRSTVSGKVQQKVAADLVRSEGADDVAELVASAARSLGESRAPPQVAGLVDVFDIRHALFLRAPEPGADESTHEIFLYDTKTRTLIARASARTTDDKSIEEVFPELVRAVYAQVSFEPAKRKKRKPKKVASTKPFYERWWFWTGVGVVAAGGAAAAGYYLWPESTPAATCPTGSVCGEIVISF